MLCIFFPFLRGKVLNHRTLAILLLCSEFLYLKRTPRSLRPRAFSLWSSWANADGRYDFKKPESIVTTFLALPFAVETSE